MATRLDDSIPTRQSLLNRLKDWTDQESWRDFFDTYWRLLYTVATKAGLSDAEAQDIVQETVAAVAKKMPDFRYDPAVGSFKNWLLTIARRRIIDYLRRSERQPARPAGTRPGAVADGTRTATVERIPDPAANIDAIWQDEWKKNLMAAAIECVRGKVDPKQFQIFDCRVLKQWPVRDVARTLEVSIVKVYSDAHRVSGLVKKELRRLERKMS